jgi:hypothetical protein
LVVDARPSIRKTTGGTGILLFVSFYEHRVVVLPDDAILEKSPGHDWGKLCDTITSGIKDNRTTEALEVAIASCGKILGEILPRQDDDEDELSNELILIDGKMRWKLGASQRIRGSYATCLRRSFESGGAGDYRRQAGFPKLLSAYFLKSFLFTGVKSRIFLRCFTLMFLN